MAPRARVGRCPARTRVASGTPDDGSDHAPRHRDDSLCALKTLWAFFLRFLLSLLEGPETLKKRRGFLAFFGAFFWRF